MDLAMTSPQRPSCPQPVRNPGRERRIPLLALPASGLDYRPDLGVDGPCVADLVAARRGPPMSALRAAARLAAETPPGVRSARDIIRDAKWC